MTSFNSMLPFSWKLPSKIPSSCDLILESDFLALHSANANICSILWNDFIVVKHLEFWSKCQHVISNFVR